MTVDDKIKYEQLQYDKKKSKKNQHYHQVKLINMNILHILKVKKYYHLIKVK